MSNELTLFNGGAGLPAHLASRDLNETTKALAGNASTGKRISIEGGVFRMIVGGKEVAKNPDRDMNVVVVRTAPYNSRTYYDPAVPYVRGQAAPPTCSSVDGVKPDARVKTPQASSCDKCPQNIAGSGNGDSRACRYSRRLAVVLEGDISGDVYQIQLPATSIFGRGAGTTNLPLEAYARMLASNKVNIDSVVTKMTFDTDSSTPKLVFSPVRYVTNEELATIESQANTPEAEQAVGITPYEMDTGNTAPVAAPTPAVVTPPQSTKKGSGFVPTAEPADESPVVADDAEVAAAPIPEPTKAAKTTDRAASIKNVLEAWQ